MILARFQRRRREDAVEVLYRRVVEAGRAPALYLGLGVPDTPQGRFEALALHVILVLRRLKGLPPPAVDIGQDLVDITFRELDRSLREMGVGDVSVPKRIKALAAAFYGRLQTYGRALDGSAEQEGDAALVSALSRNAVGEGAEARTLAAYVRSAEARLAGLDATEILEREPLFPDPAAIAQGNVR